MKNLEKIHKILFVAAFVAVSSLADRASAQYQPVGDDGITASPKLRQHLNERKTTPSTPRMATGRVGYRTVGDDGIAASPKLRELLDERKAVAGAQFSDLASVGYQATGLDGITASPKFREQLDGRSPQPIMVAPLK